MTTLLTSPDFPLFSISITDWLPKIGEKAFLAWMNFHTWKDSSSNSETSVMPLPLSQVIKRLKVGNSTFYNQILRPLWNYGLIELEKIPGTNQFRIHLHLYPLGLPEKANQPLTQIRDYDHDLSTCTKEKSEISPENETAIFESNHEEVPTSDSQPSPSSQVHPQDPHETSLDPLPELLSEAIQADDQLLAHKQELVHVYRRCRHHPQYSDTGFLHKTQECLPYYPHVENFAAYLYKSMMNEWNKPSKPKPSPPSTTHSSLCPPRPRDVPEWVWRQQHEPPKSSFPLSPEQQAIADQLLYEMSLLGG